VTTFRLLSLLLLVCLSWNCRPGKVYYDRPQLDPEVEAEVRRINLERFGGSWLVKLPGGMMYLDISEEGYYLTLEDSRNVFGGDHGEIVHLLPGRMNLYTYREECEHASRGDFLELERRGDLVLALDSSNPALVPQLLAVDRRERVAGMPCLSRKIR
jgi:hypothetical protein